MADNWICTVEVEWPRLPDETPEQAFDRLRPALNMLCGNSVYDVPLAKGHWHRLTVPAPKGQT
jgi:hypothetical protein